MGNIKWGAVFGISASAISIALGIIFNVSAFYIFLRVLIFGAVFFGIGIGIRTLIERMFPELLFLNEEPGEDESAGEPPQAPGSRVNITLDNAGEYAIPEVHRGSDASNEMGNIEDLVSGKFKPASGGIDRKREEVYNNKGADSDTSAFSSDNKIRQPAAMGADFAPDTGSSDGAQAEKQAFTPGFSSPGMDEDSAGLGGLPDLDSMAMAFSGGFGGSPSQPAAQEFSAQFQPSADFSSLDQLESAKGAGSASQGASPREAQPGKNKPMPIEGDFSPQELAMGLRTVLSKDK